MATMLNLHLNALKQLYLDDLYRVSVRFKLYEKKGVVYSTPFYFS